MNKLDMNQLNVPGLQYNQYRDMAEMLINATLITVFINSETDTLDVAADILDLKTGDISQNIYWATCSEKGMEINEAAYIKAKNEIRKILMMPTPQIKWK